MASPNLTTPEQKVQVGVGSKVRPDTFLLSLHLTSLPLCLSVEFLDPLPVKGHSALTRVEGFCNEKWGTCLSP